MSRSVITPGSVASRRSGNGRPRQMITTEQSDRIRLTGDSDPIILTFETHGRSVDRRAFALVAALVPESHGPRHRSIHRAAVDSASPPRQRRGLALARELGAPLAGRARSGQSRRGHAGRRPSLPRARRSTTCTIPSALMRPRPRGGADPRGDRPRRAHPGPRRLRRRRHHLDVSCCTRRSRELGGRVECRIPHRTRDGYGLTVAAIEEARRRGCSAGRHGRLRHHRGRGGGAAPAGSASTR